MPSPATATTPGKARTAALGVLAGVADPSAAVLALPGVVAVAGLGMLLVQPWRHLGRELLLAAGIAVAVVLVVVAGSARFPGGW